VAVEDKDFRKALAEFQFDPGSTVTPTQYKDRLTICDKCPGGERSGNVCNLCGCGLARFAKLKDSECKAGYWSQVPAGAKKKLILKCFLSPGDILMMTAAVRDLHTAYPGKFETDVRTSCQEIWDNNPYITQLDEADPSVDQVNMDYDLVHESNDVPLHFVHGFAKQLEIILGMQVPVREHKGEIYLTDDEKSWINQVEEIHGHKEKFWIMMAGGKYDYTAKWWDPAEYQKVVDHFKGVITFVQCGDNRNGSKESGGHFHPLLNNVLDMVGKTDLRQFIRLMHHADGVITPVSFAMHLAAAVETKPERLRHRPCIVIAGGREPSQWEAYPHHQFLHTNGMLSCCEHGGCWKSRGG